MARIEPGNATPEKRWAGQTLSIRQPIIENALATGNFDNECVARATLWGNALLADRSIWADRNRGGKRYRDCDNAPPRKSMHRRRGSSR